MICNLSAISKEVKVVGNFTPTINHPVVSDGGVVGAALAALSDGYPRAQTSRTYIFRSKLRGINRQRLKTNILYVAQTKSR